jgi:hypothetical protein
MAEKMADEFMERTRHEDFVIDHETMTVWFHLAISRESAELRESLKLAVECLETYSDTGRINHAGQALAKIKAKHGDI